MPKLTADLKVTSNIDVAYRVGRDIQVAFLRKVGADTAEKAREFVREGVGPGPHPHRPDAPFHEDTGRLRRAITSAVYKGANGYYADIFIDDKQKSIRADEATANEYGLWLEVGFAGPTGRIFRYPWLSPAAYYIANRWTDYAEYGIRGVSLIHGPKTSATWTPPR